MVLLPLHSRGAARNLQDARRLPRDAVILCGSAMQLRLRCARASTRTTRAGVLFIYLVPPAIRSRSSSVRSPHHCCTSLRMCFHCLCSLSACILTCFSLTGSTSDWRYQLIWPARADAPRGPYVGLYAHHRARGVPALPAARHLLPSPVSSPREAPGAPAPYPRRLRAVCGVRALRSLPYQLSQTGRNLSL